MLKLDVLMEGYAKEVTKTVEKDMRIKAKRAYQRYLDKLGEQPALPDEDATNTEWQNAVIDSIEGKEVKVDSNLTTDPVEVADKQLHLAFMTWVDIS